jgi:hypothetical protein
MEPSEYRWVYVEDEKKQQLQEHDLLAHDDLLSHDGEWHVGEFAPLPLQLLVDATALYTDAMVLYAEEKRQTRIEARKVKKAKKARKVRKETEAQARKEAKEKRQTRIKGKKAKKAKKARKARKEAEEKKQTRIEGKKAKKKARKARKEAEEQARKEAEEQARKEAEEQAAKEAEEQARKEAKEQARKEAGDTDTVATCTVPNLTINLTDDTDTTQGTDATLDTDAATDADAAEPVDAEAAKNKQLRGQSRHVREAQVFLDKLLDSNHRISDLNHIVSNDFASLWTQLSKPKQTLLTRGAVALTQHIHDGQKPFQPRKLYLSSTTSVRSIPPAVFART